MKLWSIWQSGNLSRNTLNEVLGFCYIGDLNGDDWKKMTGAGILRDNDVVLEQGGGSSLSVICERDGRINSFNYHHKDDILLGR